MKTKKLFTAVALICLFPFVATQSVEIRVASFNVLFGVGTPGSVEYNAVRDTLIRVDSDIVGFQELSPSDHPDWVTMAAELGYPHLAFGTGGPFAGSHRVGFYSRFPITEASEVKEPVGAKEITRWPLRIKVDVPGALNPLIAYVVHNKASSGSANEFRRAIEMRRTMSNIVDHVSANPLDTEYLITGDFNHDISQAQTASFSSEPTGLPASYSLGADVVFPISYSIYPKDRLDEITMLQLDLYQEDTTNPGTYQSGSRLDYFYFSEDIMTSPFGAPIGEVYNSFHDDGVGGLPKVGSPLPSTTSSDASDHYLLFSDFYLIDAMPCLNSVLILSEVVDHPTDSNANYVECYNSGVQALDLTGYELVIYEDGSNPFVVSLSGTLASGGTLIIASSSSAFNTAYGFTPDITDSSVALVSGNDVVALKNPANNVYDIYGVIGEPVNGSDYSMAWAYQNQIVERVPGVSDPNDAWLAAEWAILTGIGSATPGTHVACDQADVLIGGPFLDPPAPVTNGIVTITSEFQANQPASNIVATVYYRFNGGTYTNVVMTEGTNQLWSTGVLAVFPEASDVLDYYVEIMFDGTNAPALKASFTNSYTYPAAPSGPGPGANVPLFNEIRANDGGTDDIEFIELIAPAGLDMAGYYITHYNGAAGDQPDLWTYTFSSFTVPDDGVTDDTGAAIGFVVLSETNAVLNSDFTDLDTAAGNVQNGPRRIGSL